jgi:hypothetical protein
VPHLHARAAQELAAHGSVVEEVADLDARALGAAPGADGGEFPAVAADLRPAVLVGWAGLEGDLGDAADGGEGLPPEAEGADAEQVVGAGELAGGVGGEGQGQVLGGDTAAVVHDADEGGAALLDLHLDALAARVQAVLQQLLDDGGGPLDHLAGGDLGDHRGRQLLDAGHTGAGAGGEGAWVGNEFLLPIILPG